jgi:hypothetical protein
VCPQDYRHRQANRADELRPGDPFAPRFANFQNQLHFLKVFTMRQTEVTAPAFSHLPAPTFTAAAVQFIVLLGALIGVSLLLAGL